MSAADDRLAARVVAGAARSGRRYRCSTCGIQYSAEELTPDQDEDGRRIGWTCESCY